MPKTRNITRSQWDAANATTSHASGSGRRTQNQNENGHESEKENGGRQATRATRSQATPSSRGRLGVLGAGNMATVLGSPGGDRSAEKSTKLTTAAKPKGKPTTTLRKRKKQPLQDITDQFLPAPEAANRAEEHRDLDEDDLALMHQEPANIVAALPPAEGRAASPLPAPVFTSPLPPSSPPSDCPQFSAYRLSILESKPIVVPPVSPTQSIPIEEYNPWQEFDNAQPVSRESPAPITFNSDPFGFVALERKLKAEREACKAVSHSHDADDEEELDDVEHVLVADTSSPRPVRRLKRSFYSEEQEAAEPQGEEEQLDAVAPVVHANPHYTTPPTPHKDKQKRRRVSHEGDDIFSARSSSYESSPSPLKASARKGPGPDRAEDPLDDFNEEVERSREIEPCSEGPQLKPRAPKRSRAAGDHENNVDPSAIAMNLRTRAKRAIYADADQLADAKGVKEGDKASGVKKHARKIRAVAAKKAASKEKDAGDDAEEDLERWERERQDRVDYFKRLERYQVEKEDVYLI